MKLLFWNNPVLAEACVGDEELKRRLELLIVEDASPDRLVDHPAANLLLRSLS